MHSKQYVKKMKIVSNSFIKIRLLIHKMEAINLQESTWPRIQILARVYVSIKKYSQSQLIISQKKISIASSIHRPLYEN